MDQVIGAVGLHLDLFEDDALLLFDIFLAEEGMEDQVGQDVEGQREVLIETLVLKQTSSLAVKASRLPPMESTERAMSLAERLVVPLKSMCSMKCEMPF